MGNGAIVTALAAWLATGTGSGATQPTAPQHVREDRSAIDGVARLLAGLPGATHRKAHQVRPHYARRVDRAFARFEVRVGAPMRAWAADVLAHSPGETVFYPFAGADFPTAHRLYPDAGRYVLVAMQRGGPPPDLNALDRETLADVLTAYERLLGGFLGRGFFVTAEMNEETRGDAAAVQGITGALMVFAAREGFAVVAVEPVRLSEGGEVELHPGDRRRASTWDSVRLRLRREDGTDAVLEYMRVGLSNFSLRPDSAAWTFIDAMTQARTILKAASHLPQTPEFSALTRLLLRAPTIVQDETGVGYDALRADFSVELHGSFLKVNGLFTPTAQRALIAAYRVAKAPPLPFHVGYRKGAGACMLVATRAGKVKSDAR